MVDQMSDEISNPFGNHDRHHNRQQKLYIIGDFHLWGEGQEKGQRLIGGCDLTLIAKCG